MMYLGALRAAFSLEKFWKLLSENFDKLGMSEVDDMETVQVTPLTALRRTSVFSLIRMC